MNIYRGGVSEAKFKGNNAAGPRAFGIMHSWILQRLAVDRCCHNFPDTHLQFRCGRVDLICIDKILSSFPTGSLKLFHAEGSGAKGKDEYRDIFDTGKPNNTYHAVILADVRRVALIFTRQCAIFRDKISP